MPISVNNVKALYAAVNNPNNAGQKIVLAPGIYPLDPIVSSINAGRLELQKDMELQGEVNDPTAVIIDIAKLPPPSYGPIQNGPNRTGAIRLGNGKNGLSWLSVIGPNDSKNSTALSIIDTDLGTGSANITISHCIVTGGRIGIDVRNVLAFHNSRKLVIDLSNNILRQNLVSEPGTQQGQGIVLQNANGVSNATITATLKGNHVFGNIIGMRIFNNSNSSISPTDNNTINVTSKNDVFVNNKLGIYFGGSVNNGGGQKIDGNSISFVATHTTIEDNIGILPDPGILPSGIFVTGGTSAGGATVTSNNRINITLTDCTLSGNQGVDIMAFGAFTQTSAPVAQAPLPQPLPGKLNVVKIQLIGTSTTATRKQTDCYPPEAPPTNRVGIV